MAMQGGQPLAPSAQLTLLLPPPLPSSCTMTDMYGHPPPTHVHCVRAPQHIPAPFAALLSWDCVGLSTNEQIPEDTA